MAYKIFEKIYFYKNSYLNKQNVKKTFHIMREHGLKAALKKIINYKISNNKFANFIITNNDNISDISAHYVEYFDIIENYCLKSANKKSIVFTTPCLSYGGGELFLLSIAQAIHLIDKQSFHIYIVVPEFIGECNSKIHGNYDFITVVPCRDFIDKDDMQGAYMFLRMFISILNPAILHNVNSVLTWQLVINEPDFIKRHVNKNYASIFCAQYDKFGNLEGFAKDFLTEGIKHLDLLISDNTNFKHFAKENFIISKNDLDKIFTVYVPCKYDLSDLVLRAQQKNLGFVTQAKEIKLLWVGRLDEQKNIKLLFKIATKYPELQINVYGTKLLDLDTDFGSIPQNVNFKGLELNIPKIMLEEDYTAFIMTSKFEGLPNILVICGYLKIPIIAPNVGGISDLVNPNTGYLLSREPSPEEYKHALDCIINDNEERVRKISAMYDLIEKRHSYSTLCKSLQDLNYLQASSVRDYSLPVVSVIIPCYNQYQFLVSCFESVYRAYNGPLDIIVIDDCSTDNKRKLYQTLIKHIFPNIRFINNEQNLGLAATRNIGIDNAIGEYIQFLDADDILLPSKISIQINELKECSAQVIICDYLLSDNNMDHLKYETSIEHFELSLESFLLYWERGFCIPIHTALFPSEIKDIKFDANLSAKEDWLFWISLINLGYKFKFLKYNGVIYRMNVQSMTNSKFLMSGKAWIDAAYKILNKIKSSELELKTRFLNRVSSHYNDYYIPNSINELQTQSKNKAYVVPAESVIHNYKETNSCLGKGDNYLSINVASELNDLNYFKNEVKNFINSYTPPSLTVDLTIIIPIYNHFNHLWQSIKSAINQSITAKQIILLNDNSTDMRVMDLILFIEANFKSLIKVVNFQTNVGISYSQNYAIKMANSEYIGFLDCDDYLENNAIEILYDTLKDNSVDYVFTDNYHVIGENKKYSSYGGYKNIKYSSSSNICNDLLDGMVANHLKVIRKEAMLQCNLFDESISGVQDWDMALKFCQKGFTFKYIPQPVYNHRIHENSVTNSMKTMQFKLTNIVRRKYVELRYTHVALTNKNANWEIIDAKCDLAKIKEILNSGKVIAFRFNDNTNAEDYWFVNEFNAYFNQVVLKYSSQYAFICGYLWDPKIVTIRNITL
jgi:glycosyltransferase involved in cell wall biosynthesis